MTGKYILYADKEYVETFKSVRDANEWIKEDVQTNKTYKPPHLRYRKCTYEIAKIIKKVTQ